MRSSLRIPSEELNQVITQAAEEYLREVKRLRRIQLRTAALNMCQAKGLPVPDEENLEAHIDVLEALFDAAQGDPDKVLQLIDEMEPLTDADQCLVTLHSVREGVSPPRTASGNSRSRQKRKRRNKSKKRPNR